MTVVVNLFVLGLLSYLLFTISHQGLLGLEDGMTGTIFFTSFIVLYLVVIFRMILYNITAGNDHDSIKVFFEDSKKLNIFRGRPDYIVRAVSWLGTLCWGVLVTTIAAIKEAAPPPEEIDLSQNSIQSAIYSMIWDNTWTQYAYALTLMMTILSAFALLLKRRRNKRQTAYYPPSLVAIFLISLIGSVYFY